MSTHSSKSSSPCMIQNDNQPLEDESLSLKVVEEQDNDNGRTTIDPLLDARSDKRRKILIKAKALIRKCDVVIKNALKDLDQARELLEPVGLSVDSSILDPTFGIDSSILIGTTSSTTTCYGLTESLSTITTLPTTTVMRTTAGHSNTDHLVRITGDPKKDRIEELKRAYQRRMRSMQPECRGEDRWDKPKIPGERRRRIVREKDSPQAPPEPPSTGYVIFVGQMTTKIRHDRPNDPHNQSKVIKEISNIWKMKMTDLEREYYNEFAQKARDEYQHLLQEFRATGQYQPSRQFEKLQGVGPWVRVPWHEKNALERELATYETVLFPPRPPALSQTMRKEETKDEDGSQSNDNEAQQREICDKKSTTLNNNSDSDLPDKSHFDTDQQGWMELVDKVTSDVQNPDSLEGMNKQDNGQDEQRNVVEV